jgi:hypothetical protein
MITNERTAAGNAATGNAAEGNQTMIFQQAAARQNPVQDNMTAGTAPRVFAGPETKVQQAPPMPFAVPDSVLALLMIAIAFLGTECFDLFTDHGFYGSGVPAFTAAYAAAVLFYARHKKIKPLKESGFWLIVMAAVSSSYIFVWNKSLMLFNALFLRMVMVYFAAVVFGTLIGGGTGNFVFFDGISHFLIVPFGNFTAQWKAVMKKSGKGNFWKPVLQAAAGILIAVPLFMIVLSLLMSADSGFEKLLEKIFDFTGADAGGHILAVILSLPLGCYLYGLLYGCANRRCTDRFSRESVLKSRKACAVIPRVSILAVLVLITVIYGLFLGLQGSYYFDAMNNILPQEFTYAEYARKGFFELLMISIINLCLILFTELFCRKSDRKEETSRQENAAGNEDGTGNDGTAERENRPAKNRFIRFMIILLSLMTLFIIATAFAKMYIYIRAYGLTALRVIPSLFMLFLAAVFVLVIAGQFRQIPVVRISIFLFAAGYAVLSVSNMDAGITSYNLSHYRSGELRHYYDRTGDHETSYDYSLADIEPLFETWKSEQDPERKEELLKNVQKVDYRYSGVLSKYDDIRYASFVKSRAVDRIREMNGAD